MHRNGLTYGWICLGARWRWALVVFLGITSLAARVPLFPQINVDLVLCLIPWVEYIRAHGGVFALADRFSDYAPAYTYFLTLVASIRDLSPVLGVKLVSCFFDLVAAAIVALIVSRRHPAHQIPGLAFVSVLWLPTVMVDSAMWGQCDIIYTACLLAFLYMLLTQRSTLAVLCFALACSFKLQAVLLSPLLFVMLLKKRVSWWLLALPLPIYLLIAAPAWLLGRPLLDLLLVYLGQAGEYRLLSMSAPSIYRFFPGLSYEVGVPVGLTFAALLALLFALLAWRSKKPLTDDLLLLSSVFFLTLMPFVLPKMHERYFFPAALFALVLVFFRREHLVTALLLQVSSLTSYLVFLKAYPTYVVDIAAVMNLIALGRIGWAYLHALYPDGLRLRSLLAAPAHARAVKG